MENIENVNNLTIETIYKMVLEMKSKLDFLESETHVLQSDKASSFMESIEPKLGNLETGQMEMQADIKSIEPRLSKVETDIVEMKADIKSIELRLGKVETDIVEMQADIKNIETRLNKLETKMAAMQTDIGNIKEGIASIAAKIEKILSEQSKFKDDVYKWGVALMIGVVVSVSSFVSLIVMFVN